MKIKLEEYIGGSRVRLSVDDAPMTALKGMVNAFVRACDTIETHRDTRTDAECIAAKTKEWDEHFGGVGATHLRDTYTDVTTYKSGVDTAREGSDHSMTTKLWSPEAFFESVEKHSADFSVAAGIVKVDPSEYEAGLYTTPAGTAIRVEPEQPKRKRRTKAEMAAAAEQPTRGYEVRSTTLLPGDEGYDVAEQPGAEGGVDEPGLPLEPAADASEPPSNTASANASETPISEITPSDSSDSEVTDSELNRYCVRLAQHFGNPQKVFDLSKPFVPEGAVARPTNIRGNSERWAFIRQAQIDTGLSYHG